MITPQLPTPNGSAELAQLEDTREDFALARAALRHAAAELVEAVFRVENDRHWRPPAAGQVHPLEFLWHFADLIGSTARILSAERERGNG